MTQYIPLVHPPLVLHLYPRPTNIPLTFLQTLSHVSFCFFPLLVDFITIHFPFTFSTLLIYSSSMLPLLLSPSILSFASEYLPTPYFHLLLSILRSFSSLCYSSWFYSSSYCFLLASFHSLLILSPLITPLEFGSIFNFLLLSFSGSCLKILFGSTSTWGETSCYVPSRVISSTWYVWEDLASSSSRFSLDALNQFSML